MKVEVLLVIVTGSSYRLQEISLISMKSGIHRRVGVTVHLHQKFKGRPPDWKRSSFLQLFFDICVNHLSIHIVIFLIFL